MILRVYDPAECDDKGVPLDWECCRWCVNGRHEDDAHQGEVCGHCAGHGSLRAAALVALEPRLRQRWGSRMWEERGIRYEGEASLPLDKEAALAQLEKIAIHNNRVAEEADASFIVRCEGCGHPMTEGEWVADPKYPGLKPGEFFFDGWVPGVPDLLAGALGELRAGREPFFEPLHYSLCDKGCRHGGPGRASQSDLRGESAGAWLAKAARYDVTPRPFYEASWRPVDIRTLGWPHDLREDKLAVLCLRCLAERKEG
jgi:hypothetical protein